MPVKLMRTLVKQLIESRGYKIFGNEYLPIGYNWILDVERLSAPRMIRNIFDVGANVGQTCLPLAAKFPDANIHSFEPSLATFTVLQSNVSHLPNVKCENIALGNESKSLTLHHQPQSVRNSLVELVNKSNGQTSEVIRVETIQNVLLEKHIDHLDLLKTDTEGFDLEVLSGASPYLSASQIDMIIAEVGFHPQRRQYSYLPELLEFLLTFDYELYCIYDQNHAGGHIEYADALFLSPTFRQTCPQSMAESYRGAALGRC